jgi:hypothetical protein
MMLLQLYSNLFRGRVEFTSPMPRTCENCAKSAKKNDIVLIFDEIQCGVGRTGKLYAKEHFGIEPDIMTLAKALGNGVPIGAILSSAKVSATMEFGDHGTTFGGNPLACSAANAVVDEINTPEFLSEVHRKGELLRSKLKELQKEFKSIKEVRGLGLMVGMECTFETKPLMLKMLENGVIANATAGNVLRLVPPLIITDEQITHLVSIIKNVHSTTTPIDMLQVAIIGATGYTGSELVRILSHHPYTNIALITSESRSGDRFSDVHPSFEGICDIKLQMAAEIDKNTFRYRFS